MFGSGHKIFAQVSQGWTQTIPNQYGKMIALDGANNAFVAGSDPLNGTILTVKYDPNGILLWQRIFDNPGTREQGSWVTVDKDGNAIVTGYNISGANRYPRCDQGGAFNSSLACESRSLRFRNSRPSRPLLCLPFFANLEA